MSLAEEPPRCLAYDYVLFSMSRIKREENFFFSSRAPVASNKFLGEVTAAKWAACLPPGHKEHSPYSWGDQHLSEKMLKGTVSNGACFGV